MEKRVGRFINENKIVPLESLKKKALQVRIGVAIKAWTLRASCFREYGFCSKNILSPEMPLCNTMSSVYPET